MKISAEKLISLPHARGGVSAVDISIPAKKPSSPRPWGCFCLVFQKAFCSTVFPTPVGVFLRDFCQRRKCVSLPHARGGVSQLRFLRSLRRKSSPRPWGCFPILHQIHGRPVVFPTPVGVFLYVVVLSRLHHPLPHARGGVSLEQMSLFPEEFSSPRPWGCFQQSPCKLP